MDVYSGVNKELQPNAGAPIHSSALHESGVRSDNAKLAAFCLMPQGVAQQHVATAQNRAKATCPGNRGSLYSAPSLQTPLRASR